MRKLNEIKYFLLSLNLINEEDTRSERVSSYILSGSLIVLFVCFPLAMLSRFLLDGLFDDFFVVIMKAAFALFWVGVVGFILSSNKII